MRVRVCVCLSLCLSMNMSMSNAEQSRIKQSRAEQGVALKERCCDAVLGTDISLPALRGARNCTAQMKAWKLKLLGTGRRRQVLSPAWGPPRGRGSKA